MPGCWLVGCPPRRSLPPAAPGVTIAAAADLKYALDSLVTIFNRQHSAAKVTVVYGSSGKFYEQLRHGAPFDMFFSADSDYPGACSRRASRPARPGPTPWAASRCGARS
ncbi:MAG: substrate-binding domain-containing protein [Hymenobacter sp.]